MLSDVLQNRGKSPNPDRIAARDRHVVLTSLFRRESYMAARLPSGYVPQRGKRADQVVPGEIAGKPHTAMTSSRTK
jgi:hypothetical protein